MPIEGYIGIDSQPYKHVDIVTRVPPIPYENNSVESVFLGHTLEHIPPWDMSALLLDCYRVLAPGGTLTVVVPDADKARLLVESKRLVLERFTEIVYGAYHDDMPHWSLFNKARLDTALTRAGFTLDPAYRWKDDARVYDRATIWQAGARGVK